MQHQVKKGKFGGSHDATKMMYRKMCYNFFRDGHITTTKERAKMLRGLVDRLIYKLRDDSNSNRNYVLRYITNKAVLTKMYTEIKPLSQVIPSGYTRIVPGYTRASDGAQMVTLRYAHEIPASGASVPTATEEPEKNVKQNMKSSGKKAQPEKSASSKKEVAQKKSKSDSKSEDPTQKDSEQPQEDK